MLKKKRINEHEFCRELFSMNKIPHVFLGSAVVFKSFPGDDYLIQGEPEIITRYDRDQLNASQFREH